MIVWVFGHLGADWQELQRLSKPYIDRNCAVVAATSPLWDFILAQHGNLRSVTNVVVQETETMIRQLENENARNQHGWHVDCTDDDTEKSVQVPIVVHLWSNGGAFLWEQILKDNIIVDKKHHEFVLLSRVQSVLFDSCPCYLHMPWNLRPFWNDAFPFPKWSPLARKFYLVTASVSLSLWCLFTGSLQRSQDFWKTMMMNVQPTNNNNNRRLIYLYTTNDKVTDAARIDNLIREQQQQLSRTKEVHVFRYDDSGHCQLAESHPEDYARAIDLALACTPISPSSKSSASKERMEQ